MGIYLNPNNENFRWTLVSPIYVDKTMMIKEINHFIDTGNKYICCSRPRRFGKTIAGNMLTAYYSKGCDSREMFVPFKIAKAGGFEEKLNRYNVIYIDMNSEYQNTTDKTKLIKMLTEEIKDEMRDEFPQVPIREEYSLAQCILKIYSHTNETFILIFDEYDVFVREQVEEGLFNEYLSFLNGLFKSNTLRPAIALAYLTGILPVVRDKVQSKLNNFREYTFLNARNLAEFTGFTSEEVKRLCEEYDMDYSECRRWYDGYDQNGFEIYNPESVVQAVENHRFKSYWNFTSTYQVISDLLERNFAGTRDCVIRMLSGESVDVSVGSFMNTLSDFKTRNDIFTYLIHIGYLAYDMDMGTCRIPNREIWTEWEYAVKVVEEYKATDEIIEASKELLQATIGGDEKAVAEALDKSHIHVTSNRSYNNEDALQSAIYLAYLYALNDYTIIREATAGRGFADVVFLPVKKTDAAMIIELKRNGCAESAVDQIRRKRYFECLSNYQGNLLFVGVNYDEKTKEHACRIERFEKKK